MIPVNARVLPTDKSKFPVTMSKVAAVATIIIVETFKMTNIRFWAVRKLGAKMVKKIKMTIFTPIRVAFLASNMRLS